MTSAAPLFNPWPDPETRNRPGPVFVDFDPIPIDFDFLHWPLTKSQNFRQGLSCSVFRVDSNFELHFFVWSSKIGQLTHSSLWFLQRLYSWHLQEIFSCLSNLKPSSSFRLEFEGGCWRYILDILAQCSRPKPSPACTSSLGFSCLYILMLWLIVTQDIVLLSYT